MPKIVIIGNSGSGKSTLAASLARQHSLAHIDLDTIAWAAHQPPTRRPLEDSAADMAGFRKTNEHWVMEGCYTDLITHALTHCSRLIFLNPGIDACVRNCQARPFEPHKYSSPAAQDRNLAMLIDWVREYATRNDEFSLVSHRRLFDSFDGEKIEYAQLPQLVDAMGA